MSKESINFEEMGKYLKKLEWDKEDLEHAKQFINKIAYLSEEKFMKKDFDGLEEFEYFIANNNKILVPTLGQYSSGKSSILNILIGEEYLPTSEGICTNIGVIIEYIPNKNISELYEIKLIKNNKYFSFEKPKLICKDKTKIKDTIDKINKEHRKLTLEDSFLLLKVNIELFELYLEQKYKEKILLIDFPGLGVLEKNNFFSSDVLSPLINQSDSFLFFNQEVINSDENQEIIIKLFEKIKNRKISFSYQNCLFILNKWDKYKGANNYSLIQAKNDLKDIFQNNKLDDIFKNIDAINCSAKYYNDFKKEKNTILNFEGYIQNLKDNFEEDYELDYHNEDEDKNKLLIEFINKDIEKKKMKIKEFSDIKINKEKEEFYTKNLENILKGDYKLEDGIKFQIINNYLILANNIDNHELCLNSNKKILDMKIIQHILLSIDNIKKNIENKGIDFLTNIHNTIIFILRRLDNPKKIKMKYSKIKQSQKRKEEIESIFFEFKNLIQYEFNNYLNKENQNINKYIKELNQLFTEKKKQKNNLSNKILLGEIEKEKIEELKINKKIFFEEMKKHFESLIIKVNSLIKIIKNEINIDENCFVQKYFETSDTSVNKTNPSWFWRKMLNFVKLLGSGKYWSGLAEYILHKKILFDDRETLINKSIENFNLVKQQNKESMNDYIKVFIEQLDEFEKNVKDEVQKMIDLSYTDFTKFTEDSKKIINESANEFNNYIKNKYN